MRLETLHRSAWRGVPAALTAGPEAVVVGVGSIDHVEAVAPASAERVPGVAG